VSRLSQAILFLNAKTSDLTNDWVKTNLTDITVTQSLRELRKTRMKEIKKDLHNSEQFSIFVKTK
jgi:hypothetical protein